MTDKEFVQQYVPFSELKKAGFFPKEMKFNDYEAITKRFLYFWDYKTMSEYINGLPELYPDTSLVSGKFPDKINEKGELKLGGGFHLSFAAMDYEIICPICTFKQSASVSTSTNRATKKCKGCKRIIEITVDKDGIYVAESK